MRVQLTWVAHKPVDGYLAAAIGSMVLVVAVMVTLAVSMATGFGNTRDRDRDAQTLAGALQSRLDALIVQAAAESGRPESYLNIYGQNNPAWFDSEWGKTARKGKAFEFAAVTDDEGRILLGESVTGALVGGMSTIITHASELLDQLQTATEGADDDLAVGGFTRYEGSLAIVAGTVIHGTVDQASIGPKERRLLWIGRRIKNEDLVAISDHYSLPRLQLVEADDPGAASLEIRDLDKHRLSYVRWQAQNPADGILTRILFVSALAILLLAGLVIWGVTKLRGMLQRRNVQEEVNWRLARFDPLTGLPNVFGLEETFRQTLGPRGSDRPLAIAQIGVDGLAELGAAYGREVADRAFRQMAERIDKLAGTKAILARSGPAELTLAAAGADSDDVTGRLARDILTAAASPLIVDKHQLRLGVSVGTADSDRVNVLDTLKRGDIALSAARSAGGGRVIYFDPAEEDDRRRQIALDADMRTALKASAFDVVYQPIVEFETGRVVGAEAMLRWRRGETVLSANEFMPAAERSGLVDELGLFALQRAIEDFSPIPKLTLGLDFWPSQLSRPELPERVGALLNEFGFAPGRLQIEMTETFPIKAPGRSRDVMGVFHGLGVKLALDAFGTGRSSVAFLGRLPFDRIKLDRNLLGDLDREDDRAQTVKATLVQAKKANLTPIATGVERAEEAALLAQLGCTDFQGPLFSRPLSFEAFVRLLQRRGQPGVTRRAS
jgi:diguanylate cyclase (GGDEF)-like protein